ncbi:MAG: urease accessory protein UreF [Janthinobacterium lividum]
MTADTTALLRLLAWLSPAFPTGAFAHSHGLEWATEAGDIADRATAHAWLDALLRQGDLRSDAILLRHAHRAATRHDHAALAEIAALAEAATPGRERRDETLSQGTAFAAAARTWGELALPPGRVALPVAVAATAAVHAIDEHAACAGFLHAAIANLTSAAVRLVPLGQTDGLRILHALEPAILATAQDTATATLDDLGTACLRADLASLRHETQRTRLFRT